MDLAELRTRPLSGLETLYRDAPLGPLPSGSWRGLVLAHLETPGARRPWVRAVDWMLFDAPTFGIDFDARRWWFMASWLQAGRFTVSAGRSRWRETDTLRLRYDVSRLPGPVRDLLYDEVKPLDERLCLGLGGINAGAGEGDHFYFALVK